MGDKLFAIPWQAFGVHKTGETLVLNEKKWALGESYGIWQEQPAKHGRPHLGIQSLRVLRLQALLGLIRLALFLSGTAADTSDCPHRSDDSRFAKQGLRPTCRGIRPADDSEGKAKQSQIRASNLKREGGMKPSATDEAKGKFHEVKGKIKEKLGETTNSPALEVEGKDAGTGGKVQKTIG
jgi:uncharacterized protein YjbJ (UPF0337 family)